MSTVQTLVQTTVQTLVQTYQLTVQTSHLAPYRGANEVWTRLDGLLRRSGLDCGLKPSGKWIEKPCVTGRGDHPASGMETACDIGGQP